MIMYKVLHIYPKDDALTAHYLSLLTTTMQGRIEMMVCDEKADFEQCCAEQSPDIIHQHGHCGVTMPNGCRLVITANGVAPLVVDRHSYYAIIARSQIEARRLNLPRTEVIRNPLITKTTTFDEVANRLLKVYGRVMDSNPLPLLDKPTRQLLASALKVGLLGDKRWSTAQNSTLNTQYSRRLRIYAELEGVDTILNEGLRLLSINPPARETIDNYLPTGYSAPASMQGRTVIEMLRDVSAGHLSLRRLADLFVALYNPHLDESELLAQLEQNELKPLFQSVLQILSEQLLLDEGFMPCAPADNRLTQQLRTLLTKHLAL